MRRVFWSRVINNPILTMELYVYWKPRTIIGQCTSLLHEISEWKWMIVLFGAAVVAFGLGSASRRFALEARPVLVLSVLTPAFAALPNMWAFASPYTLADVVLSILTAMVFFACWLLASLIVIWMARRLSVAPKLELLPAPAVRLVPCGPATGSFGAALRSPPPRRPDAVKPSADVTSKSVPELVGAPRPSEKRAAGIRRTVGGAFKVATAARMATIREEMAIASKATSLIPMPQRPD